MRYRRPVLLLGLSLALAQPANSDDKEPARLPITVEYAAGPRPPEQKALFDEVLKTLEREQPQNPGRQKIFAKLQLRGLTPQNRDTHLLRQTGWTLELREAGRIEGGWRATVAVRINTTRLNRWPVLVQNLHYEIYAYRGGKLTLEDDYTDPELRFSHPAYDLSEGLLPAPEVALLPPAQPPDPYYVAVWLEAKQPTRAEEELAQEVEAILKRERPQNPGRLKSLGKLELESFRLDGKPGTQKYKYKIVGWAVRVRKAERIPGGWRATVWATPRLQDEYSGYTPRAILTNHVEVYSYRDGKLRLVSEEADSRGLQGLR